MDEKIRPFSDSLLRRLIFLLQGYFKIHFRPRDPVPVALMDDVSVALSRALHNLPLDSAHFLIYAAAYGVLLPAVMIVASMECKHSGTRRPSRGPQAPGRDNSDLAITSWSRDTGFNELSEFVVYTELIMK